MHTNDHEMNSGINTWVKTDSPWGGAFVITKGYMTTVTRILEGSIGGLKVKGGWPTEYHCDKSIVPP